MGQNGQASRSIAGADSKLLVRRRVLFLEAKRGKSG